MKINFTGRHVEVSEALRIVSRERLEKMTTFLDDVIDVHVTFSVDNHRHSVEVSLKTRHDTFVASSESSDMYKSLAQAMDKLDAQAHKRHDKKVTVEHVGKPEIPEEAVEAAEN
ncbi:MAG: ribosome-associated translation inhibitor RaiA [Acidobacteriota bacterium]|nr:ribosome-associated translation inhibitor RaiA [Acidobacteriota bacterium]